jgi:hypothetical protein
MANPTLFQLATTTVGSGGVSSVTFSAIPQVYTDLVIKGSVRDTDSGSTADNIYLRFNGSSSGYSEKTLTGTGAAANSYSQSSIGQIDYFASNSGGTTANTFNNFEIYIPNYSGSNNKSVSLDSVNETNATNAYSYLTAGLWSNTAAITSITISIGTGTYNLAQYSTLTLYGVRNY